MKKIVLVILFLLSFGSLFAQSCPNGNFELWNSKPYTSPDTNWVTSNLQSIGSLDSLTVWPVTGIVRQAVHMQTVIIGVDTQKAYIVNNNGDPTHGQGGVPYTQRPGFITGFYKYNLPVNDSAMIWVIFKRSGAIIADNKIKFRGTGSISTFTAFSFPLDTMSVSPDSVIIAATSSNVFGTGLQSGSWLELDQLAFAGTGITQIIPGGSFDSFNHFSYDVPTSWNVQQNGQSSSGVIKSLTHYEGSYSAELISTSNSHSGGGSSVNVCRITTGNYNDSGHVYGGLPYTNVTDTLTGYYMFIPDGADTGNINITFSHGGTSFVWRYHSFDSASTWTYFEVPFTLSSTPDSMRIEIQSGSWYATTPGSALYLDHLQFKSHPLPSVVGPIMGTTDLCVSSTLSLSDTTVGGTWSSADPSIATVSTGGTVAGIAAGTTTISYIHGGAYSTSTVTVYPIPTGGFISLSGVSTICAGSSITLTDSLGTTGGIWRSMDTLIATVDTTTGILHALVSGIDTIKYRIHNICGTANTMRIITVNPLPYSGIIRGALNVCVGSSIVLSDSISGGVWSAINANATLATDTVTGIMAGADTIIYSVTNSCGTITSMHIITVNPIPHIGTIMGAGNVCVHAHITLSDSTSGGIWSVTNANATDTAGVVAGVMAGIDTVKYTVTSGLCTNSVNYTITINPLPLTSAIVGSDTVCVGFSITLSDSVSGGTWISTGTFATITSTGVLTGDSVNSGNILYVTSNSCGSDTARILVNVFPYIHCSTIVNETLENTNSELKVYPNPNNGIFNMRLTSLYEQNVDFSIKNIFGVTLTNFSGTTNKLIEARAELPTGIYFLYANTGSEVYICKVVLVK